MYHRNLKYTLDLQSLRERILASARTARDKQQSVSCSRTEIQCMHAHTFSARNEIEMLPI